MAQTNTIKKINVATASFPVTINLDSATRRYKLYGSLSGISSDKTITYSGTPVEGMTVEFDYSCTVTTDGNHTIILFGVSLPQTLLQHKMKLYCEYTNAAWQVYMLVSMEALTASAGGVVIVGNTGFTTLAPGTAGKVIVDSGTAFAAVALSGDVTVDGSGVMAIGADKVTATMVKDGDLANTHINAAAGIVFTKMAALTASRAPVLNASGFIEASSVTATELGKLAGLTADTAELNKLDGLTADTAELNKLDGVTASTAEINYLVGVTGAIQDQIDSGIAKLSYTEISADTTATASTLKSVYIIDTTGGAVDLTLPDGATLTVGTQVRIVQIGGNTASLVPDGSDKIYPITSYTVDAASASPSGTGKSILAVLRSATEWQVIQAD